MTIQLLSARELAGIRERLAGIIRCEKHGPPFPLTHDCGKLLAENEALRKLLLVQVGMNPPWEYYGIYDDQRCFFCGQGKDTCEHPTGNHQEGCVWEIAQQLQQDPTPKEHERSQK